MSDNGVKTPLVDLLRRVSVDSWAEITEPNGWSYHTNIGRVTHEAADIIEAQQKKIVDLQNYILKLDRRQNAEIGDKEDAEIQG
jgi:hypothetical protein